MKIVVKVGGSLVFSDNGADAKYLGKLIPVLESVKNKHQLIVSIGGGRYLRNYMRYISMNDKDREEIYIQLLYANVLLLSKMLKMKPLRTIDEIDEKTTGVIGGIAPGRSTDANAAIAASIIKADMLVKMTNVDGIYDKDPKKYKDTKLFTKIKFSELKPKERTGPVDYGVLDPLCIETIKKHKIKSFVISGENPENLLKAIKGQQLGTLIS